MNRVLQVFAKAPVAGAVKTRLMPALDAAAAATLHRALVERTLSVACSARPAILDRIELWCCPDTTHPFFMQCAQRFALTLRLQCGGDLGLRMHYALEDALANGDLPVLIGTDCPSLDQCQLQEAFAAMADGSGDADVVLLPTEDGGYALIGARRTNHTLFEGIAWGSSDVYEASRIQVERLRWHLHTMAIGWDVDRPEDLVRLRQHAPSLFESLARPHHPEVAR